MAKKKRLFLILSVVFTAVAGFLWAGSHRKAGESMKDKDSSYRTATFAGGCFWCSEADFQKIPGVVEVVSGYTGGHKKDPTYEEVCRGNSGHVEAVQIRYDPERISYAGLLNVFWRHIDPTDPGGQFADRGSQYTSLRFGARLRAAGVLASMGRKGDAYDNALCEAFFATLNREVLSRCRFRTRQEARSVLFAYLEGFYNRRRRHSALGYLSPEEFERRWSANPESVSVTLSTKAG